MAGSYNLKPIRYQKKRKKKKKVMSARLHVSCHSWLWLFLSWSPVHLRKITYASDKSLSELHFYFVFMFSIMGHLERKAYVLQTPTSLIQG